MPPVKGQMLKYSEQQMQDALAEVVRGVPVATAAKLHNVPRITLLYKSKGKTPNYRKMGPESYLTKDEESMLVNWIISIGRAGFPVTKEQLLNSVKNLVEQLKRSTPFKNNRPGKSWYNSFLKRHPEISIRVAQNLTSSRANVTQQQLSNWFEEVSNYLKSNNHNDILNDPSRVFNADETAFFLNPKGNKVLAQKGDKTIYQQVNNDEKECLTVLITGNANGDLVPPTVIFQYERIPQDLAESIPAEWGIGKSKSGWMTGILFYEFITNIFDPWLEEKKIQRPVILFIDGHTSHLTLNTSKFCKDRNIILVALFPNATHLLQPMDVSVFRALKGCWKDVVHEWRVENIHNPILKKRHFSKLLKKVLDAKINPDILKNGFRKCGLCPWNPNAITMKHKNEISVMGKDISYELKKGLEFLNKYIEPEKLEKFKNSHNWEGDVEEVSLFKLYKNVQSELEKHKNNETIQSTTPSTEMDITTNQSLEQFVTPDVTIDVHENTELEQILDRSPLKIVQEINEQTLDPISSGDSQARSPLRAIQAISASPPDPIPSGISLENDNGPYYEPVPKEMKNKKNEPTSIVPSPFKRALFWPDQILETTKRKKKEKIPSVVTSKSWQNYYEKKEQEKRDKEFQKLKRAEERQEKREKKKAEMELRRKNRMALKGTKNKPKNDPKNKKIRKYASSDSTEDEEWIESGSSMDDISMDEEQIESDLENLCDQSNDKDFEFKEGDFVLVSFPGKKKSHRYACIIQKNLNHFENEVIALNYSNESKTVFRVNERDVSVINTSQIIEKLESPNIISSGDRVRYEFSSPLAVDG